MVRVESGNLPGNWSVSLRVVGACSGIVADSSLRSSELILRVGRRFLPLLIKTSSNVLIVDVLIGVE